MAHVTAQATSGRADPEIESEENEALQADLIAANSSFEPKPIASYRSLVEAFRSHCESNPTALAVAWLDKACDIESSFTYAQLWHYSGVLGHTIRDTHKLQRGDRAMIVYPFGIDFLVAFLACMRVGVVVVSVYPPNPKKLAVDIPKFAAFVEDSNAKIALTTAKYSSMVVGLSKLRHRWPKGLRWITTNAYRASEVPATPQVWEEEVACEAGELCLLQYTSGSTGAPKGVMISHGNLAHQCALLVGVDAFLPWTMVTWCPQFHDMGLFMFLSTLYIGGRVYGISPHLFMSDPCIWPRAIERYRGEVSSGPDFSVALCCKRMQQEGLRFDLASLRWVILGAEPTQLATVRQAVKVWGVAPRVFKNSYGLAEHCVMVATRGTLLHRGLLSAGRISLAAALGVEVRVAVEEGGRLVEAGEGEAGEICVRSPSCALGYWRQPDASHLAFGAHIEGLDGGPFLRTGDLGLVAADNLFVTARLKDLIIVNGKNVAPSDLERAAEAACAAALRPGASVALQADQAALLLCEVREAAHGKGGAVELERLAEEVRVAVERESGVPLSEVLLLPRGSVPKTTSGKVQRRRAAQLLAQGHLRPLATAAAATPQAEVGSLRELLEGFGVEEWGVPVAHNGLCSLQLLQVVNAAKASLALDLSYSDLVDLSAADLLAAYAAPAPEQQRWRSLHMPAPAPAAPRTPPLCWRCLVDGAVVGAVVGAMGVAALPSVALLEHAMRPESEWWLLRGRPGPLAALSVVLWMGSYTALCVLAKWALLGRLASGPLPLWSARFVGWLAVERLWGVWEWAVGRFLLKTPWLNALYRMLGSDVALSAKLSTFYRCWDLVAVGPRARVDGRVYGRMLDGGALHLAPVALGADAAVEAQAVVLPGAAVGEGVRVEAGALVPPHAQLPPHTRWHAVPCRQRPPAPAQAHPDADLEGQVGAEKGGGGAGAEEMAATRALLPLLLLSAVVAASAAVGALLPATELPQDAWTAEGAREALRMLLLFVATGAALLGVAVALKWSFLSGFLTDALAALVAGSFFPWLDKSWLVNWWHRAFGMHVGRGATVMLTAACPPSRAHLCSVGPGSMLFNAVLAPRPPASLWQWCRGRCAAPWTEERDIVVEEQVGLYVVCRVEAGVRVRAGAQGGAFTRLEKGQEVEAGALMVGDPAISIGGQRGEAPDIALSWGLTALSGGLMAAHLGWLVALVVLALQLLLAAPREGVSVYAATVARVSGSVLLLLLGLGLEVVLFKRVVFGAAREGEVSFRSVRAVLFHHASYIAKRQEEVLDAFLAGTVLIEAYLALLGADLDVGRVWLNTAYLTAQDAELISVRAGALIDEMGILSGHNVTLGRLVSGRVQMAAGAVMHPLSALFMGSVGTGSAILPRSKPLRELHIAEHQLWAGAPAFQCRRLPAPHPSAALEHAGSESPSGSQTLNLARPAWLPPSSSHSDPDPLGTVASFQSASTLESSFHFAHGCQSFGIHSYTDDAQGRAGPPVVMMTSPPPPPLWDPALPTVEWGANSPSTATSIEVPRRGSAGH